MSGGGDLAFERVLLKLSGEALMGSLPYGTDPGRVERIAAQVAAVQGCGRRRLDSLFP